MHGAKRGRAWRMRRQKQLVKMAGGLAAVLLVLYLVRVVLLPMALAAVLCYLVLPLARGLEGVRVPKGLAAGLALACFFVLVTGLLMWGRPLLWRDFAALGQLRPMVGQIFDEVSRGWQIAVPQDGGGMLLYACRERVAVILGKIGERLMEQSLGALPGLLGSLAAAVFTPVFAFYLLRDREQLMELVPRGVRPLAVDLNHILQAFVRGYLLVAAVVGVLFGLLVWLFGLNYAFSLGLIMLLAELVPYLGPFLAFFPCVALGLVQGKLALIKLLLIWLAVQQLENLLISPHIMSGVMRLPPFYIMLAVLIGGFWWGVFGMILAVPLAAAIKVVGNALIQWWNVNDGVQPEDFV